MRKDQKIFFSAGCFENLSQKFKISERKKQARRNLQFSRAIEQYGL